MSPVENYESPYAIRYEGGGQIDPVEEAFAQHPPTPEQLTKYAALRNAAKVYAKAIRDNTPASKDQTEAIDKVRESLYAANVSIALGGLV